jgi:AcrR family transcriptional regulator
VNEQRVNIVSTAYQQFKQYGFKSVTMDDLARSLGLSKKTIYEHFKDKEELVLESVKYMLHENQTKTETAFKDSIHAIDQIMKILTLMESMVQGMNMVCFLDLQRYYHKAYQYLMKHKEDFLLNCISKNLEQGIQEGYYREDVNIEIISRFRLESALLAFQSNMYPSDKYDMVKVNHQLFSHYMYGIASLKGHKLISKYFEKYSKK